ncbi:hypothetical protein Ga0100231_005370 [Opitutaceae bacterium TAV4]|nr:hypothetical protein Ga0100231_005370 [Opitutaceae bacterium TAV4]RRK02593.1 hypothetical protein Ga0100230_005620 [Opitutaceae bacterium TAV3]
MTFEDISAEAAVCEFPTKPEGLLPETGVYVSTPSTPSSPVTTSTKPRALLVTAIVGAAIVALIVLPLALRAIFRPRKPANKKNKGD